MIRLKDLIAEQHMDFSPGMPDGNSNAQKDFKLIVNYAHVDFNLGGDFDFEIDGELDGQMIDSLIGEIEMYLKDRNTDLEYVSAFHMYDQTRAISDIKLDCKIQIDGDEIDLTIMMDATGSVLSIDIQDASIADKHGINDQTIEDYLQKVGL